MKNSKIPWTAHTFNPWWGCEPKDAGCKNCYARELAHRFGHECFDDNPRRIMSDSYFKKPMKWNEEAEGLAERPRVFLGSMCDFAEDLPEVKEAREKTVELIKVCTNLDWLFLTKRPGNYLKVLPFQWSKDGAPDNVWLGTSASDWKSLEKRYSDMHMVITTFFPNVTFLSLEPLLENVVPFDHPSRNPHSDPLLIYDWILVGGESGPKARPFDPAWAMKILAYCEEQHKPAFMKQFGTVHAKKAGWKDSKGEDMTEWPPEFQRREFPTFTLESKT